MFYRMDTEAGLNAPAIVCAVPSEAWLDMEDMEDVDGKCTGREF